MVCLSLCVLTIGAQTDSTIHTIERVEVVAMRHSDGIRSVTPVQQVDRDRMRRLGIHTMTDALRHMAGITVRDYGGAGGLKTVSVRGIGARHTAVVYDGIALSDCQTGEIDLSRYSLEQLASLRLVIGDDDNIFQPARNQAAAATLYLEAVGTDTSCVNVSGVSSSGMNASSEARFSLGSFGLVNPSVLFLLPRRQDGRGWDLSLLGDFFHADNDYPFTLQNVSFTTHERRSNSRMNAGRGELNLNWYPNASNSVSAKVYYYDNHRRLPGIVHYYTHENHERLTEQMAFGQLSLRSQFTSQWALLVNAKYNWSHTDYQNRTPGSGLGDATYWQREAYASASLLYAPLHWLSFDYAADLQYNSLNSTITTYARHPHRTIFLQALAGKFRWPRLTVVARALYSHSTTGSTVSSSQPSILNSQPSFSPSFSLSYRLFPYEELYLRLMAKHVFRLPTFNELYFYHIGTADLQPEKTSQFNLGLTWELRPLSPLALQVTLDAYANRVTDKIVAVPFNMFVWRIMNIGKTAIYGLDLTANAAYRFLPRQSLALSGNYSYQRAMNVTVRNSSSYRNQLPYTPLHTYCATLSWENPWTSIAATLNGQAARWTTVEHSAGTRIEPFATADLSLWHTFAFRSTSRSKRSMQTLDAPPSPQGRLHQAARQKAPSFTLRFTLQNLLNRQYDIVAHYPMPGRSWQLQLIFPITNKLTK